MISKFNEIKYYYNKLGFATRFIIKISLITVITSFTASIICFILKDYLCFYTFLYTASEELLIVTRSCAVLGLVFSLFGIYAEKKEP